jgi:hypothetical protein
MAKFTREDALEYHRLKGKPGKVAIMCPPNRWTPSAT